MINLNKQIILLLSLVMLLAFSVYSDADVQFVLPDPVVKNVPFHFDVQMKSSEPVARIQFYVTGEKQGVVFQKSMVGTWLSGTTINQNEVQDSGHVWKFNIGPKGTINDKSDSYKNVVTLWSKVSTDDSLKLQGKDDLVAKFPGGESIKINSVASSFVVKDSICGDGVVGYLADGVTPEACDTKINPEGCSKDCSYIEGTHKIQGSGSLALAPQCALGARQGECVLVKLEKLDLLSAKLDAIFGLKTNGTPGCFPYKDHPSIKEGKGFCIVKEGVAQQIPELLKALRVFYNININ